MDENIGLTSEEALRRIEQYGPNTLPEEKRHPLALFLQKFWAPIPWMLEMIIVMEISLNKFPEALIIFALLLFNASLSFFQEDRAKKALLLLKSRLEVQARALRDGQWKLLSAKELVPGDSILIRMGDIIPADVKIVSGHLLIDQSALTGESMPVDAEAGKIGYAGSIAKHGEAFATVQATGKNTYFGKTAEIVRIAKAPSHLEKAIFLIIKYLIILDAILVFAVFIYGFHRALPVNDLILFSLLLLVASVPVALPATYTLATAIGSQELIKSGVLVTRLSAIEEAAAMNILCVDKTGTITKNILEISDAHSYSSFTKGDLLFLAGAACEEATQDPLDLAILQSLKNETSIYSSMHRIGFIPFDPENKYSEAIVHFSGEEFYVRKGAPSELIQQSGYAKDIEKLAENGSRVLAVVFGKKNELNPVGLIAFKDQLREDSKQTLQELSDLGIRIVMITGDTAATARSIAKELEIGCKVLLRDEIYKGAEGEISKADIIAGVFPEDKFHIISLLQKEGYICGMTGDGVNDAPALKKAEVGIAVSNAGDVAKASASLILTRPGLVDILEAVKTSRRIYQRMLTYTLNKIIKTLEIAFLLGLGLIFFDNFIISQLLIVLLLFANDFMTMSISTDNASYSRKPDKWDIQKLISVGSLFALFTLGLSFLILLYGRDHLLLSLSQLQTLVFLMLVFTGQFTIYLVRERNHFWHSRPSYWMIASSIFDLTVASTLAISGILMTSLSAHIVLGVLILIGLYFALLDFLKVRVCLHYF